eukprot:TRINITY_DN89100_c3_g1_i1.p1 TRINITY_DN89100_c3_g1~~TRINITY_DN89100_c3_g1_i1.p1  ORF type:complete len:496 (-),score=65.49 TRINITY_DN89100_c3_g1_i1:4727-6145(-)
MQQSQLLSQINFERNSMEAGNRGPISEIDKITEEELYELFELDIPKPSLSPKPSAEPAPALPSSADALKQMENNLFIFAAAKAGMETVDKEKIGKIIEEASKGTEYYKKQKEKLGAMKVKVAEKREQLENAKKDPDYYIECEAKARELIEEYMQEYDVTRTWIHIDMDMFFAAVEIRDNPSLADKPVAVGSYAMISTANYIARKYGVRSAMPGFIGKKLCPSLVFVGGNYKKYKEVSVQVMSILQEYDPDFESMGLDEANLDVTDHLTLRGWTTDEDKIKLAKEIQARIYEKVKLTASCGIGANRLLAKISCDMHKPNGVTLVPFDSTEIAQFMATLSVRKIPGIGKVGEQLLNGLGFVSCKDLLDKATDLYVLFDEGNFEFYIKKALGISRNEHEEDFEGIQKSISVSETFRNISLQITTFTYEIRLPEFQTKIEELAEVLGKRMAKHGIVGKTVSLEIKTYKFEVKQKQL